MDYKNLDSILKQTFEDHNLSRSERDSLKDIFSEYSHDVAILHYLRNRAFDIAREASHDSSDKSILKWLEGVVRAIDSQRPDFIEKPSHAVFSPGHDCLDAINQHIERAFRCIDICVFTITDNRIVTTLIDAYKRGVLIRVITDNDKAHDRGSDANYLYEAGIMVKTDTSSDHMHHKFALFDAKVLMNGSFNWTRSASERNHENLIMTEDTMLVESFQQRFDHMWDEFPLI